MALTGKKILLLDDEFSFGEILQIVLEDMGNQLTHFCRVRVADGQVVLMNPTGKESVLSKGEYDFALVDGRIKGGNMNGWDITPHMVRLGLPVVAVSGADSLNKQMLAAGAKLAVRKDLLYERLRNGALEI